MEPEGGRFRHEALFYRGTAAFLAGISSFVREGLRAGEAVQVAVVGERAGPLREELGADAAGVDFLDMAEVGRNPARMIPAWRDWAERNTREGRPFRGVSEPAWAGRSDLELRECRTLEHLLNTAFDEGPGWQLLCPYDTARLPLPVLAGVAGSHPVTRGAGPGDGESFDADGAHAVFAQPLPELGPALFEAFFRVADLHDLRSAIRKRADLLGLRGQSLDDFVLVADELAGNSVRHGGGSGRLALWACPGHAVCEVRDAGLITDPLVGRRRPGLRLEHGGAGLWTANRLCDLLLIHSAPGSGTAVRAYLSAA